MPNAISFRVIKDCEHTLLIDRLKWAYSSSANLSGCEYNEKYAKDFAEVIIASPNTTNKEASRIYILSNSSIKIVR
jgi:hypothetical protein